MLYARGLVIVEFLYVNMSNLSVHDDQRIGEYSLRRTEVQSHKFEQDIEALNIHNRTLVSEGHVENLITVDSFYIFRVLPACSDTLRKHGQGMSQVMRILIRVHQLAFRHLHSYQENEHTSANSVSRSTTAAPPIFQSATSRH